jgi:two-component system chemotaxis response regulator CheB
MSVAMPFAGRTFGLVALGCSAGGFDALMRILPALPSGFPTPVAVAIHLSPESRTLLPEIFGPKCRVRVKEAEDKEPIAPGTVYFAPPGYHLLVETDRSFSLSSEEPVNFSRPSIDVLFESAAVAYREDLLGILLTGASSDGARGLGAVRKLGGSTFVQDPADAEHPAMPRSALDLGPPSATGTLAELRNFFAGGPHG